MEKLPDEILLHMFSFLTQRELLRLITFPVCSKWRNMALDSSMWKVLHITGSGSMVKHDASQQYLSVCEALFLFSNGVEVSSLNIFESVREEMEKLTDRIVLHRIPLRKLSISRCDYDPVEELSQIGKECSLITNLKFISNLTEGGETPKAIAQFTNLESLSLETPITLEDMEVIATSCKSLRTLQLHGCDITNKFVEMFARILPNLLNLSFTECKKNENGSFFPVGDLKELQSIEFDVILDEREYYAKDVLIPLAMLKKIENLKIRAYDHHYPDVCHMLIPEQCKTFARHINGMSSNLISLTLEHAEISDDYLNVIACKWGEKLQYLKLRSDSFTDSGIHNLLIKCQLLETFILEVVGSICVNGSSWLPTIEKHSHLKILDVHQCPNILIERIDVISFRCPHVTFITKQPGAWKNIIGKCTDSLKWQFSESILLDLESLFYSEE